MRHDVEGPTAGGSFPVADAPRARAGNACPRSAVSADEHRDLMSTFPTGVAVITTLNRHHQPLGMTCSSLVSVTLRPPTLLVCVGTGSLTLRAIHEHGSFGVNILRAGSRRVAEIFSSAVPDRFATVAWRLLAGTRAPWLVDDALAYADCTADRDVVVGDHCIVIGTVQAVTQRAGMPLIYGMRRFGEWSDAAEQPAMGRCQELRRDLGASDQGRDHQPLAAPGGPGQAPTDGRAGSHAVLPVAATLITGRVSADDET
jgi:flavin reductase (NADH)